ncbi:Ubiquitin-conjugating enzyme subunit [Glugoides intestinalis]
MTVLENNLTQSAKKRLLKELEMINSEKDLGISAKLVQTPAGQELLDEWDLFISGPVDTLYEGFLLHARISFPSQYPYQPPTFKFLSPIFHPNVYENGKVCISILHTDQEEIIDTDIINSTWTPGLNVRTVGLSIVSLLSAPNIYSAANVDASKLYRDEREKYENLVKDLLEKGCKKVSNS